MTYKYTPKKRTEREKRRIRYYFGFLVGGIGIALMVHYISLWGAIGIIVFLWGHNIQQHAQYLLVDLKILGKKDEGSSTK